MALRNLHEGVFRKQILGDFGPRSERREESEVERVDLNTLAFSDSVLLKRLGVKPLHLWSCKRVAALHDQTTFILTGPGDA